MVEEQVKKRVQDLKAAGRISARDPQEIPQTQLAAPVQGVPEAIKQMRREQLIWCKQCYQQFPSTRARNFLCPVCGSTEYLTSRPF
jgi:uncharacterized paraquat-inducible protein A